jgi:hypothetical protein
VKRLAVALLGLSRLLVPLGTGGSGQEGLWHWRAGGQPRREETLPMRVAMSERILAVVRFVGAALVLSAAAAEAQPAPRKIEIETFTCAEFATLQDAGSEARDRVLIYFNGYLDGTHSATVWDEVLVGKRIDEAMRLCKADPQLSLLNAFKRAWTP